ncbi:UNVERIFIED_CONTAM: hypothetical protein K2H54_020966 [Gekko kuhli]
MTRPEQQQSTTLELSFLCGQQGKQKRYLILEMSPKSSVGGRPRRDNLGMIALCRTTQNNSSYGSLNVNLNDRNYFKKVILELTHWLEKN